MMNFAMPDLRAAGKNPLISSTSVKRMAVTHKVIHRKCVELFASATSPLKTVPIRQKTACSIFMHGNKTHTYQGLGIACLALRTILSTKNVQNFAAQPGLSTASAIAQLALFLRTIKIAI
jgi:hypothetical protein